jgi:hypothetical protein
VELALVDGWIRFWWQGELLPLPAELQNALDEAVQRARQAKERADALEAQVALKEETIRALEEEVARLRARKNGTSGTE